jgi:hypothetical protein
MPKSITKSNSKVQDARVSYVTANAGDIPFQVLNSIERGDYGAACGALRALARSRLVRHLLGVCLIRDGRIGEAVEVFRALCLNPGSTVIRVDADDLLKINYATALLLAGIPGGALDILAEVDDHSRKEEIVMRAAIDEWVRHLSFWRRIGWKLKGVDPPNATVPISGELGILPIELPLAGRVIGTEADPNTTPPRIAA